MARKKQTKPQDDNDLMGDSLDDLLDGIDAAIAVNKIGDTIQFVHAGGKVSGIVIELMDEGVVKVAQTIKGRVFKYMVKPEDILRNGETPLEHISRQKKKTQSKAEKQAALKQPKQQELFEEDEDEDLFGEDEGEGEEKPNATPKKKRAGKGVKTQRELVEEQAELGKTVDEIAEITGVERKNVVQYHYRWRMAKKK